MVNVILASHGDLSKGILNTAEMIIGKVNKNVEIYSLYPGENPLDYMNELKGRIENSDESWIILTDIQGGSVNAALVQLAVFPNVVVFAGMNLSLVLEVLLDNSEDLNVERFYNFIEEARMAINFKDSIVSEEEEEF